MIAGLRKNQFVTLSIVLVLFLSTVVCVSVNCQRVDAKFQTSIIEDHNEDLRKSVLIADAAVRPAAQTELLTQQKNHEIATASLVQPTETEVIPEETAAVVQEEAIQTEVVEENQNESSDDSSNEEQVVCEEVNETSEPENTEEPVYEEPVAETEEYTEPVVENYEEPVYEEPAPVYEEPAPVYEEPAAEPVAESNEQPADSEVVYEEPAAMAGPQLTYLGNFMMTAYCPCSLCCGAYATGYTASGTYATEGVTVAMGGVPFGKQIMINGHIYTVEDRGTAYGHVDIFFSDHSSALAFGLQYADVYLVG